MYNIKEAHTFRHVLALLANACQSHMLSLPSDFLIRLAVVTVPTSRLSRGAAVLVPDGIQHSRFTGRVRGFGHYVLCWKDVIDSMIERSKRSQFHAMQAL